MAKFRFRGREALFSVLLAGVLVPAVVLAVPQYLLLAKLGPAGTYWLVLLPGSAVSVLPLIVLFLVLRRLWRADLLVGALTG